VKTFVKICGLTDTDAVAAAVAAGADAVGFVFAESQRRVSADRAAELAMAVPARIKKVAVMQHPERDEWALVQQVFQPDWLQTDAEDFAGLDMVDGIRPLPVYRDHAGSGVAVVNWPQRVLFEGAQSGRGQKPDWNRAAHIARRCELVLAGGLDSETVGEAINKVRPWGVDVSSGVEQRPGIKDPDKITAFVQAVRRLESKHAG
jgi:phosphoribosylanthranilate isomerase